MTKKADCSVCGKNLGGFFGKTAYRCEKCGYFYCSKCFKSSFWKGKECPRCGGRVRKV